MKIKAYIKNFNGVMDGILKSEELERVIDPRDAQVLLTWQDVRGEYLELARINKEFLHKPLIVVQHGAGATRDYQPPENFPLLADKFCCWGTEDYNRLIRIGYGDKGVLTGSTLISQLKPREKHVDRNIVFVPIVTTHEEPANLITFYELKKIELEYAQKRLLEHKQELILDWKLSVIDSSACSGLVDEGRIPYHSVNRDFRLISKLTPLHDKNLYIGSVCESTVGSATHMEDCVRLLTQTDLVVGMVESTFPLLTMAMDIPVVICKEWEFKIYAGKDYSNCEHIRTDAVTYAETKDLRKIIEQELSNPERLKEELKQVVLRELGDITTDPDKNIIKLVKEMVNG